MSETGFSIDELERDLGPAAASRILLNAGGQRRYVPTVANVAGSKLEQELGDQIAIWLAARFGGDTLSFPSRRGQETREQSRLLTLAVLEAGLTEHTRSAKDIADEFGVTERWVTMLRADLRGKQPLPLFDHADRTAKSGT